MLITSSQYSWLLFPEIFPPALIEALSTYLVAVSKHSGKDHQGSHAGPCCPLCVRTVTTKAVVSEKSTSLPNKAMRGREGEFRYMCIDLIHWFIFGYCKRILLLYAYHMLRYNFNRITKTSYHLSSHYPNTLVVIIHFLGSPGNLHPSSTKWSWSYSLLFTDVPMDIFSDVASGIFNDVPMDIFSDVACGIFNDVPMDLFQWTYSMICRWTCSMTCQWTC